MDAFVTYAASPAIPGQEVSAGNFHLGVGRRLGSGLLACLSLALTTTLFWCAAPVCADDITVFANLGPYPVYVYRAEYYAGAASAPAGPYSLPAEAPAGWRLTGLTRLDPGTVHRTPPGSYYLRDSYVEKFWDKLPRELLCAPLDNVSFNEFIEDQNRDENLQRLVDAHKAVKVVYQRFPAGVFTIDAAPRAFHRLAEMSEPFDFSTRSELSVDRSFQVPGEVVNYRLDGEEARWTRDLSWNVESRRLRVRLKLWGGQVVPFGPREKGYYRGSLSALYVTPATFKSLHRDEASGQEYMYHQSGVDYQANGTTALLHVTRNGELIHMGHFRQLEQLRNEPYYRYNVKFAANSAPEWVHAAVRNSAYEIWVPTSGNGTVLYSADGGESFVAEKDVPPAGRIRSLEVE